MSGSTDMAKCLKEIMQGLELQCGSAGTKENVILNYWLTVSEIMKGRRCFRMLCESGFLRRFGGFEKVEIEKMVHGKLCSAWSCMKHDWTEVPWRKTGIRQQQLDTCSGTLAFKPRCVFLLQSKIKFHTKLRIVCLNKAHKYCKAYRAGNLGCYLLKLNLT